MTQKLQVSSLESNSPAARAGLREGDTILKINGHDYLRIYEGRELFRTARVGQKLSLEVERSNRSRSIVYFTPEAAPLEDIPGVVSEYDVLRTSDGVRLRTIVTRPKGRAGRLPAIYFVQWLSCDSIELPLNVDDGWQRMIRLIAEKSGVIMMRTERAGSGDSEGPPCWQVDYNTELSHHREGLAQLKKLALVDPNRIVIYGASMGGNLALLLAKDTQPAGVAIWGTATKSWFEHLVEFNRRHLELSGRPPGETKAIIDRQIAFLVEYVIHQKSPLSIAAERPDLNGVWQTINGTSDETHYGRPIKFHQQAQQHNWLAAAASIKVPALVMYGEFDWFEELDDHAVLERTINRGSPQTARLVVIPRMNHHFSIFPTFQHAYDGKQGLIAPEAAVNEFLAWLANVLT